MDTSSDMAPELPFWLSLQWPQEPTACQDGDGNWWLQFGAREGAMSGWRQLRELHLSGAFDSYFRVWKVRPLNETGEAGLADFLAVNHFGPMDPELVDKMRGTALGKAGTVRVIPQGYSVRGTDLGVLHELLEAAQEHMGSNVHVEWYEDGCQILCTDVRVQSLVRQLLVVSEVGLKSPLFPAEVQQSETPQPRSG